MQKNTFHQEYHYNEDLWFINTSPKNPILNIELTGITHKDPTYHIVRKNQWDMYIFEYVISGEGYININNKRYAVKGGDAYIIRSYTNHEYYADVEHPFEKVWMNVSGTLVDHLLIAFNLLNPVIICRADLMENYLRLKEELNNGHIIEKLCPIVLDIIYKMSENLVSMRDQNLSVAQKMRLYIDKNISKNITPHDVAEHFYISTAYANRIFKAQLQQTINQYINESRLNLASQWLKTGNFTVREISDTLGYCNDNYFSSLFKRYFGISPKQYQMQHKKKKACNTSDSPINTIPDTSIPI